MRFSHELGLYLWNKPGVTLVFEAVRPFDYVDMPGVGYLVSEAGLATQVLTHPNFTSGGRGGMGSMITPIVGGNALFNMDGERHQRVKQQLVRVFARPYVDLVIAEALGEVLERLRCDLLAGKTIDFAAVSREVSARITLHMLGISVAGAQLGAFVTEITEAIAHITSLFSLEHVEIPAGELARAQARYAHVQQIIDDYGSHQPNALLHRLQAEMDLSEADARGLVAAILAAGTETTNATLPRILALLLDTGQFELLRARRELMPGAIDEGLRVSCASPAIIRAVQENTQLGEYTFREGRRVIVILYNVLKRADHARDPRRFDIQRQIPQSIKHLAFGRGPHFCLGFVLIHREMEVMLNTLLDLPGSLRIVKRSYPQGETFPGYRALWVRLEQ